MQDLTVTLVQSPLAWLDAAANREHFAGVIAGEAGRGNLVVLPEMFTTGFTMAPEAVAETMDGPSVAWMADTARRHGITLCGSLVIRDADSYRNRLVWMPPDGRPGWYDKRHLFRMADEHRHYVGGRERAVFEIGGWRVCPLICYDLRFPVWSRGANAFDLQLYVANWPAARRSAWRALLPARAVENQCYVAGVNRIGLDGNGIRYSGDTLAADPFGNLIADAGDRAGAVSVRLDGRSLLAYREKFPAWRDADDFRLVE
ncbi:MAG: amidohydrolase [Gammaproteobacteria bacterium]|nr:amidohydrolase [Gammaproteobacteria bacterium]